jgi:hypothetical protein
MIVKEKCHWHTTFEIDKFFDPNDEISKALEVGADIEALRGSDAHIGHEVFEKNVALNEGLSNLIDLIAFATGTKWDASNARIGVGDSATAATAADGGLLASTNKLYKAMDGSYPLKVGSTGITWRATFATTEANYAWNEYVVINGASEPTGIALNRKVDAKGTKTNTETWTVSITITFS